MPDYITAVKRFTLLFCLFLIFSIQLHAQDSGGTGAIIISGPDPFSLDAESAVYCINILKNSRYLEKNDETGVYKIIEVDTVWSWFLEYDESYPQGHRRRYDIVVNGGSLDWDNSYIEYGGEMVNFRLLFTYRNQYPPKHLKYRGTQ